MPPTCKPKGLEGTFLAATLTAEKLNSGMSVVYCNGVQCSMPVTQLVFTQEPIEAIPCVKIPLRGQKSYLVLSDPADSPELHNPYK